MRRTMRWVTAVPLIAGLVVGGCHEKSAAPAKVRPATVEHIDGSAIAHVTLTDRAAQRVGIQTARVQEIATARSGRRLAVPYAAVLYDAHGETWVYTSPEPLKFVRHAIRVDYIDGDRAVLSDGPPVGTQVVTTGAVELFGTEFEIGH
jgi:hypothetical protein